MSFLKRSVISQEPSTDEENDEQIDPELRLRTVRTAASAIAESIRSDQRAERRKRRKRSRFFTRKSSEKKRPIPQQDDSQAVNVAVEGTRRNIYVNYPLPALEADHEGEPIVRYKRNKVRTTSMCCNSERTTVLIHAAEYTILTFFPKNLFEQFRRYVLHLS